jgi:hypothetical protein
MNRYVQSHKITLQHVTGFIDVKAIEIDVCRQIIDVCRQIIDAISSYANFFGKQILHKSRLSVVQGC